MNIFVVLSLYRPGIEPRLLFQQQMLHQLDRYWHVIRATNLLNFSALLFNIFMCLDLAEMLPSVLNQLVSKAKVLAF